MTLFIMTSPDLITPQTLIVSHMCPFPDCPEVATRMFAIAVKVVRVATLKVLGRERCKIALTHDLLTDVIDAVAVVDLAVE